MVEPEVSVWDIAALEPIVTEAGGRMTHIDGSPWTKDGTCLTTCGSLHDEVVELANSYGDNRSTSQPSSDRS
jgi:histidinol-phosphatase